MSEVSPVSGSKDPDLSVPTDTIYAQAKQWYGIELSNQGYLQSAIELERICEGSGKKLVLRDWTYVDFIPCHENVSNPSETLQAYEVLRGKCDLRPFAVVRDVIDVYISLSRKIAIDSNIFFSKYRMYIESLVRADIPILKYEDFTENPEGVIKEICDLSGIPFDQSFREYDRFVTVKGDLIFDKLSRGAQLDSIRPLPRRRVPRFMRSRIEGNGDMAFANEAVGYSPRYDSVEIEPFAAAMSDRFRRLGSRFMRVPGKLLGS